MDINLLRAVSTLFVFIAFLGIVFWAYSSKRNDDFERAAQLPFADDLHEPRKGKGAQQ